MCVDTAALDAFIDLMRRSWADEESKLALLMRLTGPGSEGNPKSRDLSTTFDRVLTEDRPEDRLAYLEAAPPAVRVHLARLTASLILLSPATP